MNGVYGTVKPAFLTAENIVTDVEILWSYRANRGEENGVFSSVDSGDTTTWFTPATVNGTSGEQLPGAFNLRLPVSIFNAKGIYTVYIRPREIHAQIIDVGVLSEYPDVRGLVFKTFNANGFSDLNTNGSLVGYRVEYFGLDDDSRSEDYTVITSSNKVATIIQNVLSTNQKAVRYRFDDSSNLLFCTVSPSTAPSYNANALPYIGTSGEYVRLVNTKFDPVMLEIELVDNDEDTLATLIGGDQIRNADAGLITTYNEDKELFRQYEYSVVKETTGKPLYEIKRKMDTIIPQDYQEIISQIE